MSTDVIQNILKERLNTLEDITGGDVLYYSGPISQELRKIFKDIIEKLKNDKKNSEEQRKKISIILTTRGGQVEGAEDMVNILRHHYDTVDFIIPDYAMSAGTVLAMSGDDIYMDYASSLGPIDPQIPGPDGKWIPASGYLDKVNELIEKEYTNGRISPSEMNIILQSDIGKLKFIEQAKNLTVTLLKQWLVKYKFKDWVTHEGSINPDKKGRSVTPDEKNERAEEIAKKLGDNKYWHTHGRSISMKVLWDEMKLKIKDIDNNPALSLTLREYYDTMQVYSKGYEIFIHTRNHL